MAETLIPDASSPGRFASYGYALGMTALATLGAVLVDSQASIPNLSLIFVLPVVIAAAAWGWGPAVTAALAGTAAYNFFLIEPRHTFAVADTANVWAIVWLLVIAGVVSAVAADGRRRTLEALERAAQARALQTLARTLVAAPDEVSILTATAEALGRLFRTDAVVLVAGDDGLRVAAATPGARPGEKDLEAARWSLASRLATRADVYPVEGGRYDFWPVITPTRTEALLGVVHSEARGRDGEPDALIGIVSGYLVVALERERFARPVVAAKVRAAGEQIKADLLAAVSHDLKTPLSTILFTLQSLQRFSGEHDAAAKAELLALAEGETARLSGLVNNLLEMSRIEAGAVPVQARPTPVATLVAAAAARAAAALASHPLSSRPEMAGELVLVDPALVETALANVLENAAKYAPAGSPISVIARREDQCVLLEVLDEGPGFEGPVEPLFEKFARGVSGDGRPPGTGLGLAVARSFLEAQGASIEAANRADGKGATVRIRLPLAPAAAAA